MARVDSSSQGLRWLGPTPPAAVCGVAALTWGGAATAGVTATEMRFWHCLQRILTEAFPATLSSEMTYRLPHLSQVTFTGDCRPFSSGARHLPATFGIHYVIDTSR